MSDERKLILKMLQENRISIEEAEQLLSATESKAQPQEPTTPKAESSAESLFNQAAPKVENIMGSITSAIDSVASQWGPVIEEKFDNWFQQSKSAVKHKAESQETQISEEVLSIPSDCHTLKFKNHLGDTEVVGYEGAHIQISLEKEIHAQNAGDLMRYENIELTGEAQGDIFELNFQNIDELQFDPSAVHVKLKVPQALNLDISAYHFDVDIKNISYTQSQIKVNSHSGDVSLQNVAVKEVEILTNSGTLNADLATETFKGTTRSGDILLKGSYYKGSVTSKSGYIRLDGAVNQIMALEGISSDISLNLLDGKGSITVSNTSGDIEVSGAIQKSLSASSKSGDLQGDLLVSEEATVDLKSDSGDIDLILNQKSNCQLDITTQSGDIEWRMELSDKESTEQTLKGKLGHGEGSLSAQTQSGDILLS